ncbi:MAG: DEAD/DEAH box helicase family protein [Gemmataceae bacterium]
MMPEKTHITYEEGTLTVGGPDEDLIKQLPGCKHDPRTSQYRAEARHYRKILEYLHHNKLPFEDKAIGYEKTPWEMRIRREPFPHQQEGLETWWKTGGRGVVVLPTGTGKTYLALMAIEKVGRPALIVTPKLPLLHQWYHQLVMAFDVPVGALGGGNYDIQPLTVTTYDSAWIHLERLGQKFGFLVFDECHHLPGRSYQLAAVGSIAPFRMGLTATPERTDMGEEVYPDLIGPIVYRKEIKDLTNNVLADYVIQKLYVELSEEERTRYDETRQVYRNFVESAGISMGGRHGWTRFLKAANSSPEGRVAFQAYREQKRISQGSASKLELLEKLLSQHINDRTLIFTYDNSTVYEISRRFLVPAITHQTKTKEREDILQKFHSGEYTVLVTSQVLNEGVDVPAANVGIILSGTGSVTEHVQRLGRLLRRHEDKQALLYEVIARGTAEEFTSDRRRRHDAYE